MRISTVKSDPVQVLDLILLCMTSSWWLYVKNNQNSEDNNDNSRFNPIVLLAKLLSPTE